jgi:hypothetical protein
VEEGVTEALTVLVGLGLAVPVILMAPVKESRGEELPVVDWLDVLDERVEWDCVAEAVVVFDIELEPVIVFVTRAVIELRGLMVQHEELDVDCVTDAAPLLVAV